MSNETFENIQPIKVYYKDQDRVVYYLHKDHAERTLGYPEGYIDSLENGESDRFKFTQVTIEEINENTDKVNLETVVELIELWSYNRKLHTGDSARQYLKTAEEAAEVASAIAKNNMAELEDGIGDTIVTLIVIAQQNNLLVPNALKVAYDEIKYRKGELRNGVFIKEADLIKEREAASKK